MKAARPIDGDVCRPGTQLASGGEGRSGIHTTEIEHISKDRAVFDAIEVVNQVLHVVLVTGSDSGSLGPGEECRGPQIPVKRQNIP